MRFKKEKSGKKIISAALCLVVMLSAAVTMAVTASDTDTNETVIYNFCRNELELNSAAACGVLANVWCESGFEPTAHGIDTNGLMSYGICQWNGGRFTKLKNYCAENGYDYTALEGQLSYLKYELENYEINAFRIIKAAPDTSEGAYDAGYNWARYFERCGSSYYLQRAVLAQSKYWPEHGGTQAGRTLFSQRSGTGSESQSRTAMTGCFKVCAESHNSLMGGLNSIGEKTDFYTRSEIAAANGITAYIGSPQQDDLLLTMLKLGILKKPESQIYFAKCGYSETSIYSGLSSVGYSGIAARLREIAEANGVENYSGTPAQNAELLGKLKSGKLIKP